MQHGTPGTIGLAFNCSASRRGFLRALAGTGALAGAAALLSACGGATLSPSSPTAPAAVAKPAGAKPVTLPAFQPPANASAPDFPGSAGRRG